ncbi:MAG TPA: XTP/dITP diphosphatase [archaeon]|nr:XTP/dITP diphosphatase [archaeon]
MSSQKLLIATRNRGKAAEFKEILSGLPVEVIGPDALSAPVPECEEAGSSFYENAKSKAEHWCCHTGLACLADDSGLVVDALDGAPGIYSARFAGENATDQENIQRLLGLLEGIKSSQRSASFHCCLVLSRPGKRPLAFQGICQGLILTEPVGSGGFGYDPVFFYPPLGCSFAQLAPEEKNRVSHRARALQKLRGWLFKHKL